MGRLLAFLLLAPLLASEAESDECLRNLVWEGYKEGWAVRTATSAMLGADEHRVYALTLVGGTTYRVLACGDAVSAEVDLVLHDAEGKVVAQDGLDGVQPVLEFTPTATASYYVAVHNRRLNDGGLHAGVSMAVTYK